MATVNVNSATASQLTVLLGLTTEEAVRVTAARPYPTAEALSKALPSRLGPNFPGLEIPLLDINTRASGELTATAGITPETADKIVAGRPYYLMSQVLAISGTSDFQKLIPYYTTPSFTYTDKLTSQGISLNPDPSQVIVPKADLSQTEGLPSFSGAQRLFGPGASSVYDVYALPESEAAANVITDIERSYRQRAIPAFKDKSLSRRYLNPQLCIVQFHPDVTREGAWAVMASAGLQLEESHRTAGLYTLRIPDAEFNPQAMGHAINALNSHPEVKFAEPKYFGFDDREQLSLDGITSTDLPWNLILSHIPEVWTTTKGSSSVVVAIIDSGVDPTHPALTDSLLLPLDRESFNFTSTGGPQPNDDEGHGTFIAGVLVGNGQSGITGICPSCGVLPLKVALTGEMNSYASRRDAILFALQKVRPDQKLIINLSWKTTGDIALIRDACDTAFAQGALLVASAGNMPEQANEAHYPSDYRSVVSVAAVTPDRRRADYSFYGDNVDVSAPGGDETNPQKSITSAAPGGGTTTGAGTSFAAPHVAGIAALIASQYPMWTSPQLRFCLENGTDALSDPGMGKGLCNAKAALDLAGGMPGSITGKLTDPIPRPTPPIPDGGTPSSNGVCNGLRAINALDLSALVARYGLATITAEILVARRPFTDLNQIKDTLGLTDQQFAAIQRL